MALSNVTPRFLTLRDGLITVFYYMYMIFPPGSNSENEVNPKDKVASPLLASLNMLLFVLFTVNTKVRL